MTDRENGPGDADDRLVVVCVHPVRTVSPGRLQALAYAVLAGEGVRWTYVGIVLADSERVRTLNRDYLDHDYPTDVLSFLIDESDEGIEGEVYVDLDTAAENARLFEAVYEDEVARCVVHGLLHLAGHDDATDREREAMRTLEDRYLAGRRGPAS